MRAPRSEEEFEEMYRRKGGPLPEMGEAEGRRSISEMLTDLGLAEKEAKKVEEFIDTHDFTRQY